MALFIAIIVCIILSVLMYLIILGGAISKSNFEKQIEDKEQMEYFKNYSCKRRNRKNGRKNK